jgi:hypothetical protein
MTKTEIRNDEDMRVVFEALLHNCMTAAQAEHGIHPLTTCMTMVQISVAPLVQLNRAYAGMFMRAYADCITYPLDSREYKDAAERFRKISRKLNAAMNTLADAQDHGGIQ